jgi:uracil-DNA glycosylase
MKQNPGFIKTHLELCRRLGIRYVSAIPSSSGLKVETVFEATESEAVEKNSSVNPVSAPTSSASPSIPASDFAKTIPNKLAERPESFSVPGLSTVPSWLTASPETIQAMELTAFNQDICECQKCPLGKTRNKFVFGSGNPQAEIMFVGEAPGADEDAQGLPFVGRAGQLLTKIIESTKVWKRSDVFICNVLKCRPPGNRTPLPEEVEQCRPYLEEQVKIIKPKLIMALGASAAQALLKTKDAVGKMRGKWHEFEGISLRVTYHPAALLRFDGYKKDVWEDMKELTAKYLQIKGK